jgi:hypothetical protein
MPTVNRVQEQVESMSERCSADVAAWCEERPMTTVMAAFGIGLGVGVAVGTALCLSRSEPPQSSAARVGRKVLDALSDYMPTSYIPASWRE